MDVRRAARLAALECQDSICLHPGNPVAEGHDLVFARSEHCTANFDGRDYPPGPETCMISNVGDGLRVTVQRNAAVAVDSFTASEDGQTLTQMGGLVGRRRIILPGSDGLR